MIQDISVWFNPMIDVQEVDQFGYVDLVQAVSKGYIPSDLSLKESRFNEIGDPSSIIGTPKDVFEAQRLASFVNDRANSVSKSVKPSGGEPSSAPPSPKATGE